MICIRCVTAVEGGGTVVASASSNTALKWWFAVEMRRMREKAGITRERAAGAIGGSVPSIGHLEVGRFLPRPMDLVKLLEVYGVPERTEFLRELRDRAKRGRDWWVGLGDSAPDYFNLFLGLEANAVQIESWDAHVVPGLFQTWAYADALIRVGRPDLSGADLTSLVELRMARQREVLEREGPPLVWAVIAEPALRWLVGGPDILRAQLERLLVLAERPSVEMQVLALTVGAHSGTEGTFTILSAPPELENYAGCVYCDNLVAGYYLEEPGQILAYRNALTRLQVQALKPEDTPAFIDQIAKGITP